MKNFYREFTAWTRECWVRFFYRQVTVPLSLLVGGVLVAVALTLIPYLQIASMKRKLDQVLDRTTAMDARLGELMGPPPAECEGDPIDDSVDPDYLDI